MFAVLKVAPAMPPMSAHLCPCSEGQCKDPNAHQPTAGCHFVTQTLLCNTDSGNFCRVMTLTPVAQNNTHQSAYSKSSLAMDTLRDSHFGMLTQINLSQRSMRYMRHAHSLGHCPPIANIVPSEHSGHQLLPSQAHNLSYFAPATDCVMAGPRGLSMRNAANFTGVLWHSPGICPDLGHYWQLPAAARHCSRSSTTCLDCP
jgi:hypothetical protein